MINLSRTRNFPLCDCRATSDAFPYANEFHGILFNYLKCGNCSSVFVDPIPNSQTFARMYSKDTYHDCYYNDENESESYAKSVNLLKKYVCDGSKVLDYGCGLGDFLKVLNSQGFDPYGVEYDKDAAKFASDTVACDVWTVEKFTSPSFKQNFDVVHLGDVLEHLPEPIDTLNKILEKLKIEGILFVEGPVENNPSLVYLASTIFGWIKHILKPGVTSSNPPHHLFRVDAKQQLAFFNQVNSSLELNYWRVYESGWPYIGGGIVKGAIAKIAIFFGGKSFFGITFGNRFQAVFIKK